jgi:hypothetical protein
MASIVFSFQVADPTASNPTSLNLSKSAFNAAGNFLGVNLVTLGSTAQSLLFQAATRTLTNTYAILTASLDGVNTTFRVDRAYNGVQFALQRANSSSSIFTCATGTGTQTLADNGFDSVSPEDLRLWNLNG